MTQYRFLAAHRPGEGAPQPIKLSQRLIDFAKPLTEAFEDEEFETLKACLDVAALCWNAALFAERGDLTIEHRLAHILSISPPRVRLAIQKLLVDRVTRFGDVPWAVELLITKNSSGYASVTATGFSASHEVADPGHDDRRVALRSTGSPTGLPVKIGPNEKCPCGSGRKYKTCCKPGAPR